MTLRCLTEPAWGLNRLRLGAKGQEEEDWEELFQEGETLIISCHWWGKKDVDKGKSCITTGRGLREAYLNDRIVCWCQDPVLVVLHAKNGF